MKKLLAISISCLFLFGCNKTENQIKPSQDVKSFTMTVEIVPEKEIVQFCDNLGVTYHANGCAKFYPNTKECTIYVIQPRSVDDTDRFALVGHETWHCRFGTWHSY